MARITKENLLAYLDRDWDLFRHLKDERAARWVEAKGTDAALRLAQMLLDQGWETFSKTERRTRGIDGLRIMTEKFARANAAAR